MKILLHEEVLKTFIRELDSAKEIDIAEALITSTGINLVSRHIRRFLKRGGVARLIIGFDLSTDPKAVETILEYGKVFAKCTVRRFESSKGIFHPKFILFRGNHGGRAAILGSANLTGKGWGSNYEANVLLTQGETIRRLRQCFDKWFQGPNCQVISKTWFNDYKNLWKTRSKLNKQQDQLREKVRKIATNRYDLPQRIRGYKFAFTGKISGWPRNSKLYPRIRRLGGFVITDWTGVHNADCLVRGIPLAGKEETKKLKIATLHGIPRINWKQFLEMIQ